MMQKPLNQTHQSHFALFDNWVIFQKSEGSFFNQVTIFVGFWKDCLLAELQAKMSKDCRFLLFWHHNYQESLSN